jgi:hypothetical protein
VTINRQTNNYDLRQFHGNYSSLVYSVVFVQSWLLEIPCDYLIEICCCTWSWNVICGVGVFAQKQAFNLSLKLWHSHSCWVMDSVEPFCIPQSHNSWWSKQVPFFIHTYGSKKFRSHVFSSTRGAAAKFFFEHEKLVLLTCCRILAVFVYLWIDRRLTLTLFLAASTECSAGSNDHFVVGGRRRFHL